MNPISASHHTYTRTSQTSFGKLIPVSYVVIDGHTVWDKKIVNAVTKDFVTQLRKCHPKDKNIRQDLFNITHEISALSDLWQPIKKIGNFLITGPDVIELNRIWSLSGISKFEKKQIASAFVKELFTRKHPEKLAIVADKTIIKGKEKYLTKRLYSTIY